MGDITAGAQGGNPRDYVLNNGVKIRIPTVAVKDANRVYLTLENRVTPDQHVPFVNDGSDNVLIEAFRQLGVHISPTPNPNPTPTPTPNPDVSGGGGCNAGIGMIAMLLAGAIFLLNRK